MFSCSRSRILLLICAELMSLGRPTAGCRKVSFSIPCALDEELRAIFASISGRQSASAALEVEELEGSRTRRHRDKHDLTVLSFHYRSMVYWGKNLFKYTLILGTRVSPRRLYLHPCYIEPEKKNIFLI